MFKFLRRSRIGLGGQKLRYTRDLFGIVAPSYDTVTPFMSLGRDRHWKSQFTAHLPAINRPTILDLACGSGDLCLNLREKYPLGKIVGLDLSPDMLQRAQKRAAGRGNFLNADMGYLPVKSQSIDIITGGYALRNASGLDKTLDEIFRALKPRGWAAFLDFSKYDNKILQKVEFSILFLWGSIVGLIFYRDPGVCAYIARSLRGYPARNSLQALCRQKGLTPIRAQKHFLGIIEILWLQKNAP